jgi:pyruvate formate lyase activating enzyme
MAGWVADNLGPDVPWHFTAFHPDFKMTNKVATSRDTLERARHIAKQAGIHHVYTGNIHDPAGQSTYCSGCDAMLIGRSGYVLSEWNLDAKGSCLACGQACPGLFDAAPGNWGARRVPVRPSDYAH